MSDDVFDVIIVGGGISGCVAAYMLAKEGISVVLIERGNTCGSKSVTGGRLYTHGIERIFPNFVEEAPLERLVTHEIFTTLTDDSAVGTEYVSPAALGQPGSRSYTVSIGALCRWIAGKAEEAGAQIVTGVTVTDLVYDGDTVVGVKSGEEELRAHITLLAEGASANLSQKVGIRHRFKPWDLSMGVKETIRLSSSVIEDRFRCAAGEGAVNFFVGTFSGGHVGRGFIYTNKETLSIGVTATLYKMMDGARSVPTMLEALKSHPAVAPLIAGGESVEYAGRLIPAGGYYAISQILDDGVVVVGDAAGYVLDLGYTVRGLDVAIESVVCACKGIMLAIDHGHYDRQPLLAYRGEIMKSFIERDMKPAGKFPRFLDETPQLFGRYPQILADTMRNLYAVDAIGGKKLQQKLDEPLEKHEKGAIEKTYKKLLRSQ